MQILPSDTTIDVRSAALRLDVTPQTVRNRIREGSLRAEKRGRAFHVSLQSVEAARRALPVPPPLLTSEAERELARLQTKVSELLARQEHGDHLLATVEGERDRYRAEAATAKEVALRVNAAASELTKVVPGLLEAFERQSDALRQFLAPASPADLGEKL